MAVKLTAVQFEAVRTFGADLCVSAGAGSGKTSVLVNRFIEAVTKQGCAPEEILALTFTEKAANVMKMRLVQEFLERELHDKRRAVENAYIGTIHSFCARLLRENPIEAGIDPYFIQLSKGESDLLMAGVLDRVFEMQATRPLCLELLVERGEENVRQALLRLYAQYRALGEDGSILKIMDGFGRKELQEKLLCSIRKAAGEVSKKNRTGYEDAIVDADSRLPEVLKQPLDWTVFSDVKTFSKSIHHVGKKLKEWDEEFKACVDDWICEARQELYLPHKTEFIRVFSEFHTAYENEKRARAVVDFDDLPILAIRLLSGKTPEQQAVRRRYQARFRNLFVDEFQDTSPLQARLIELLRGKKNLFLVGDRQQSIYAFRYAEPELFARYEKTADKLVRLSENFRSRAELMEWINGFFAASGEFQSLKAAKSFCLKKDATPEILRVPYGESEKIRSLEEAREAEAELIAARIEELVRSGERIEDKTPQGRPMRWGDAAILLRGRKAMTVYERALARRGIPFYSARSQGFFETPEVKDLIHFLVLLDHEESDVALAAVLRSPLAAISDDGLFWIAQTAKKNDPQAPLWKAFSFSKIECLSAEDAERMDSFAEFLARMRASKNRFTVSAALDEALRRSGYEARTLASPGGLQRVANVRKLVDIARAIESQTPLDAAEFVRTVRGMEDGDESEARIEGEDENAVLISTIHAAKGLEFPAVFLANLGAKKPQSKTGFCLASRENGFGWAVPDDEKSEKVGDTSFVAALEASDRKRNEEEGRLLYVAMTRAEEKLVLCGAQNTDAKKESTWMSRVLAEKKEVLVREAVTSVLTKGPEKTSSFLTATDAEKAVARLSLPVKSYTLALDLTVSDLLAGEREDSFVPSEEPETIVADDLERSPRNEFGTIFHRAMELSLARKGVLSEAIFSVITAPLTAVEKKEVYTAMERFWKSDMGDAVKKSPKSYPELSFIYKTKRGLLKGQLDLVFMNTDQEWVILDYKTNRFSSEAKKQDLIETYRQQLGLYALAFWKVYGKIPARTVLYFTQTHESVEVQWSEKDLQRLSDNLEILYPSVVSA